jgi:hypothetical protein
MKKIVEELASKAGVRSSYSGSTRVMYLRGEKAAEFKAWIKEKYPKLAFELKLDEGLGLRFEHGDLVSVHGDRKHPLVWDAAAVKRREALVADNSPVIVGEDKVSQKTLATAFGSTKIRRKKTATILGLASAIGVTGMVNELLATLPIDESQREGILTKDLLSDEAGQTLPVIELDKIDYSKIEERKSLSREEIDEYLIAFPIDRNAKNPYNAAATSCNVKPDYIRGRWRSLRERGLVEKENA